MKIKHQFENLSPYFAGLFSSDPQKDSSLINLALGESPYGISPRAMDVLQKEVEQVSRYPDSSVSQLRQSISDFYDLTPEMVMVGNGIDELILLCSLAFLPSNGQAVCTKSTFSGFEASIEIARGTVVFVPLDNYYNISANLIISTMTRDISLVFICNPHNPTGTILQEPELTEIIRYAETHDTIIVFDEAYAEYANRNYFCSALKFLRWSESVLVLRTFSKIYGLAGLRCGYALGNKKLIEHLSCLRNVIPFNVNRLAQAVALESIKDQKFVDRVYNLNAKTKEKFCNSLKKNGLKFVKSQTNFVLVSLACSSDKLCKTLYNQYKILVRDATPLGFKNHIRITIGNLEQMEKLTPILRQAIDEI